MIRRPPRSTRVRSSAASDVYKRQILLNEREHGLHPVPPNPEIRLDSRASRSVGSGSGLWLSSSSRTLALTRLRMVSDPRLFPVSYTHLRAHETVLDLVCR